MRGHPSLTICTFGLRAGIGTSSATELSAFLAEVVFRFVFPPFSSASIDAIFIVR